MKQQSGFTLIELLVTMGIIAVLTGMAIFNFNQSRMRARDVQRKNDLGQLKNALELYKIDNNGYPSSANLDALQTTLQAAGNAYTKVTFVDPKGTADWENYIYTYDGATGNFTITACLENTADTTRITPSVVCHTNGVRYQITNP